MENNFYTDDDFEHFLRTATDDFKMYPSRKVWHSLYNDLHPGRKWPSLAVSLVLVSAILYLGISNNNSINKNNLAGLSAKILIPAEKNLAVSTETPARLNPSTTISFYPTRTPASDDHTAITTVPGPLSGSAVVTSNLNVQPGFAGTTPGKSGNDNLSFDDHQLNPANDHVSVGNVPKAKLAENTQKFLVAGIESNSGSSPKLLSAEIPYGAYKLPIAARPVNDEKEPSDLNHTPIAEAPIAALNKTAISPDDKAWIENYAFQNRKALSRLKSFGSMQYYATTAVGFRTLKQKDDVPAGANAPSQSLVASNAAAIPNIDEQVTQKSAMNMEIGAALIYNISKALRVKTGLQFNYTNYVSLADRLNHPTETSLLLNRGSGYIAEPRISNFVNSVNGQKRQRLNNTTIQLSLPVGADIRLAGNDRIKWYAGATVQPTFVSGGNVFAISTNNNSYIEESSLLRKWNMNTSIETFISYKTSAGIIINAGPQLRYQLLSTYNTQYSFSEKLYNLGLKLGFTKDF